MSSAKNTLVLGTEKIVVRLNARTYTNNMSKLSGQKMRKAVRESLKGIDSVRFAYLFGSHAAGTSRPSSDVDVAVFLDKSSDFMEEKLKIMGSLSEHIGTDAVDVVVLNAAPTSIVGRILSTREVVIDRDPFCRHSFESLALRKYFDFSIKESNILAKRFGVGR